MTDHNDTTKPARKPLLTRIREWIWPSCDLSDLCEALNEMGRSYAKMCGRRDRWRDRAEELRARLTVALAENHNLARQLQREQKAIAGLRAKLHEQAQAPSDYDTGIAPAGPRLDPGEVWVEHAIEYPGIYIHVRDENPTYAEGARRFHDLRHRAPDDGFDNWFGTMGCRIEAHTQEQAFREVWIAATTRALPDAEPKRDLLEGVL